MGHATQECRHIHRCQSTEKNELWQEKKRTWMGGRELCPHIHCVRQCFWCDAIMFHYPRQPNKAYQQLDLRPRQKRTSAKIFRLPELVDQTLLRNVYTRGYFIKIAFEIIRSLRIWRLRKRQYFKISNHNWHHNQKWVLRWCAVLKK